MQLNNKTIAVTGANGNLGREVVATALAQGAQVALLDVAFSADLPAFPEDRTTRHIVNLLDQEATNTCFADIGPIDALCNVAGGFSMGTPTHESTDEEWSLMLSLNVNTLLHCVRASVPGMLKVGSGSIVSIAASAALSGQALMAPYTVTKSAVMRITECMSAELKDQGINVNCVLPSIIDTPQNREAMPDAEFSNWVSPKQLAEVICFLASDAASAINGAAIPVTNRV